jgi:hypothetical protein
MTSFDTDHRRSRLQPVARNELVLQVMTGLLMTVAAVIVVVGIDGWAGVPANDLVAMFAVPI